MMKRFLAILVLGLFLITPSQADDIRDFQIEGMSVGDSLLDYFTEEEIKDYKFYYPASKKIVKFQTFSSKIYKKLKEFKTYKVLDFHYKNNDSKYIILSIGGAIFYRNNMKDCLKKKDDIVSEMSKIFKDTKKDDTGITPWLEIDASGKTTTSNVYFLFKSGAYVEISCYNWSDKITEEKKYQDHLNVSLQNNEFSDWLSNEAY